MKKFFYTSALSLITLFIILVTYLSIFGVKTDKFNSKIISQVNQIEPNIEVKLNDVSIRLDPFNFGINAKTIGTNLIYKNKIIKLETIKSKISIRSFLDDKFLLTEIFLSTKPLVIKDLISFVRLINNDPKLFVAEKFVKKGYVVADLKLEFDDSGNIIKLGCTLRLAQVDQLKV